ncbi:choice-of-anchor Q domain-containing protein [Dokdonella sp.]|uniref:choice-of-anchor Q domain-containing protein n=1 Tax=Dokdonella sp. TaxID=2291710 RepID=UPI002606A8BA|nr:choice-of-anchor Q domain-containing protein [Dokdonella sp.]
MRKIHPLFCIALIAGTSCANAATFTVTSLGDNGAGSLREAIANANQAAGTDTIVFQAGLTGTITLSGGALSITDSLTLTGPGSGRVTLDAGNAGRAFKLVNANASDKTFAISGLKIVNGNASAASDDSGGGLFYEATSIHADIRLTDLVFENNIAGRKGGAISVAGANLTLGNVVLRGNLVNGSFQRNGGGLYFSRGLLTVGNSLFVDNRADYGGGLSIASPGAKATIADTVFQKNIAQNGGGIHMISVDSFAMARSALVENVAISNYGGGVYFSGVTGTGTQDSVIENTTFSRNEAQHQFATGSALSVWDGFLTVRNSTFADNKTAPDKVPGANAGGAMWVNNGDKTRATVQSTLFNRNTHGNTNQPIDLARNTGTPFSTLNVDHSLFQIMPAINVISTGSANIEADALLQALTTTHGGRTPVYPIPFESPAVDKGSNPGNLTTDQRGAGVARTIDARACRRPNVHVTDIGAYEYRGDTIFCHGFGFDG